MALVNPNIALGFRMPEFRPRNALAEYAQLQQIQGGQQAQELNALKMQEAQMAVQERNALNQAYQSAYNPDTGEIDANALRRSLSTGGFGSKLPALEKSLSEAAQQKLTQQKLQGEVAAQPTTLAAAKVKLLDDKLKQQRSFLDTLDPNDPSAPARYMQWHEANHADPDIGAALKARGITVDQSRDQIQRAIAAGPQAFAAMINASKLGTEKFMEMNKPTNQVINQGGQSQLVQTPGLGGAPTSVGTFAAVPLPAAVEAQKSRIGKASASNISVSTEKKFGEVFGGKVAEADVGKLAIAEKAPQLADSANRIIGLVQQGNVFTGPIADVKLNIARALNVAGADNQEKIANTEALVAATGQSTLDAIKGAGLGAGQGFTDKDLKFLQGVAGGTINLTAQTLTELATLQHRAASRAAEAWNKRSKEIPKEVMQGTGLSTTPIVVPPLASVMKKPAAARPEGVGNNWTFERDAAGNTAWVSPDRKSFKEAK
jgi:hypothetical protein